LGGFAAKRIESLFALYLGDPIRCETFPSLSHLDEALTLFLVGRVAGHYPAFFSVRPIVLYLFHGRLSLPPDGYMESYLFCGLDMPAVE
jgi:hypothetical protein